MSKLRLVMIGASAMVLLAGLIGCAAPAGSSQAPVVVPAPYSQQQTGLWVTGEGKIMAAPDVAILTLGVEAQAKTVAEAQAQAAEAMNKVVASLKASGIQDKDIQTQRFSIQPVTVWNKEGNRSEIIGYMVTNVVTAKVRDLAKTGAIVDAVATAGGDLTRVQSIAFTIDDPTQVQKQARDKAVADAVANAKQMASAAGIQLGKPTYISTGSVYIPYRENNLVLKAGGMPAPMPADVPISPGELSVTVSIQMVYEIR